MTVKVTTERKYYSGSWFVEEEYNGQEWSYQFPSVNYSTKYSREDLIELRDVLNAVLDG